MQRCVYLYIYLRLTNYRNIDRAALAVTLCGPRNRNINPDMKSQNLRLPQPI